MQKQMHRTNVYGKKQKHSSGNPPSQMRMPQTDSTREKQKPWLCTALPEESHFLPKLLRRYQWTITTRILLLAIFLMALKGSELYFPSFKVSVTQSYYYIYYKIYHYRNTIYQSQISAWNNLGFRFLVLWRGVQIWALCSSYCLM